MGLNGLGLAGLDLARLHPADLDLAGLGLPGLCLTGQDLAGLGLAGLRLAELDQKKKISRPPNFEKFKFLNTLIKPTIGFAPGSKKVPKLFNKILDTFLQA